MPQFHPNCFPMQVTLDSLKSPQRIIPLYGPLHREGIAMEIFLEKLKVRPLSATKSDSEADANTGVQDLAKQPITAMESAAEADLN